MSESKYFDLHTRGIGYLNRVRVVTPSRSEPFLATEITALHGAADRVQKTRFDCRVVGAEAEQVVRRVMDDVTSDRKVLVAFCLGDLYAEAFTYKSGKRQGQTGISLKTRLLRLDWVKVDGETVYTAPRATEAGTAQADEPAATADGDSDGLDALLPEEVVLDPEDPEFQRKMSALKQQGYRFDSSRKVWHLPAAA